MISIAYIYKITNDINEKVYIGKTEYLNPKDRWKEHLREYKKQRCEKRPLYDAMNKYGVENFHFEVIEETDSPIEREQYWIDKLRTYVGFDDCNGYNATLGGDGKSYLDLDKDDVIRYHTEESSYVVGNTAKYFNVDSKTIQKILRKNNIPWLNHNDSYNLCRYSENGGVIQLDINLKYILNIFENVHQANLYMNKNKNSHNIYEACDDKNNRNHYAYGYLWYYGKDFHLIRDKLIDTTWF